MSICAAFHHKLTQRDADGEMHVASRRNSGRDRGGPYQEEEWQEGQEQTREPEFGTVGDGDFRRPDIMLAGASRQPHWL